MSSNHQQDFYTLMIRMNSDRDLKSASLYSDDDIDRRIMDEAEDGFHVIGSRPRAPVARLTSFQGNRRACSKQTIWVVVASVSIVFVIILVFFLGIRIRQSLLDREGASKEELASMEEYLKRLELPEIESAIPKIFHLSHHDNDAADDDRFQQLRSFSARQWKDRPVSGIPTIKELTAMERRDFINRTYPWLFPYYLISPKWRQEAIARYLFLYTYGGWFVDSRSVCIRSGSFDLSWQDFSLVLVEKGTVFSKNLIASPARHPLWIAMLRRLLNMQQESEEEPALTEEVSTRMDQPKIKTRLYPEETYEHAMPCPAPSTLLKCRERVYANSASVHIWRVAD